jgi:hypothetical protein
MDTFFIAGDPSSSYLGSAELDLEVQLSDMLWGDGTSINVPPSATQSSTQSYQWVSSIRVYLLRQSTLNISIYRAALLMN